MNILLKVDFSFFWHSDGLLVLRVTRDLCLYFWGVCWFLLLGPNFTEMLPRFDLWNVRFLLSFASLLMLGIASQDLRLNSPFLYLFDCIWCGVSIRKVVWLPKYYSSLEKKLILFRADRTFLETPTKIYIVFWLHHLLSHSTSLSKPPPQELQCELNSNFIFHILFPVYKEENDKSREIRNSHLSLLPIVGQTVWSSLHIKHHDQQELHLNRINLAESLLFWSIAVTGLEISLQLLS